MTVTVELLNKDALTLLQNLERLHVLKLLSSGRMGGNTAVQGNEAPANISSSGSDPAKPESTKDESPENCPAGYGGANGMFVMSSDFDEPLEDFNEYMY
jgi:hypothetical protein